jgi:hypothetical protein
MIQFKPSVGESHRECIRPAEADKPHEGRRFPPSGYPAEHGRSPKERARVSGARLPDCPAINMLMTPGYRLIARLDEIMANSYPEI